MRALGVEGRSYKINDPASSAQILCAWMSVGFATQSSELRGEQPCLAYLLLAGARTHQRVRPSPGAVTPDVRTLTRSRRAVGT